MLARDASQDTSRKPTREASRLGSTSASLKLKGIDGDPHNQWSVWFNSRQSEGPHQGLTCYRLPTQKWEGIRKDGSTAAAWLSSARAVGCSLKWDNERNPYPMLQVSSETAPSLNTEPYCSVFGEGEEGGDDVKSARRLCPGPHTPYNGE